MRFAIFNKSNELFHETNEETLAKEMAGWGFVVWDKCISAYHVF